MPQWKKTEKYKAIKVNNTAYLNFKQKITLYLFVVLPLKFSATCQTYHEIFIKEHAIRKQESNKPVGRTLFVTSIPPYANENGLKNAFALAGETEAIEFQTNSTQAFKIAYIVFKKLSGLTKALELKELEPLSTNECPVNVGIEKWKQEYNNSILNHEELQKQVNEFMAVYDRLTEEEKLREKQQKEDDEGWTVVTKKGRSPGISRKENVENKITAKLHKGRKRKELKNFYRFQIRESKMNQIAKLREKFEEDKKRINAFKLSRKFKPF